MFCALGKVMYVCVYACVYVYVCMGIHVAMCMCASVCVHVCVCSMTMVLILSFSLFLESARLCNKERLWQTTMGLSSFENTDTNLVDNC